MVSHIWTLCVICVDGRGEWVRWNGKRVAGKGE